jgi:ribosomal protein S18 acetylase RimI-like enzyme
MAPATACDVRTATLADLDTVIDLRLALLAEHYGNPLYRRIRPDARDRARALFGAQLQSPAETILLAERAGRVVGMLRCIDAVGSPLLSPPRYGYITSVYVIPACRRQGVLRTLLAEAEQWCHARGLGQLRLHSTPENPLAQAAWEAMGFGIVEHLRSKEITRRAD